MILTCPQCGTQYKLDADKLSAKGKKVKCTNCSEIWFQMPDPDELKDEAGFTDTPSESRNNPEPRIDEFDTPDDDFVHAQPKLDDDLDDFPKALKAHEAEDDFDEEKSGLKQKALGFGLAALVFLVVLGVLFAAKAPITKAWPASYAFYQLFGAEIKTPSAGLVFDRLSADIFPQTDGYFIKITGQIINLTSETQIIPMIKAQAKDVNGDMIDTWLIEPPESEIEAEGTLSLSVEHELSQEVSDVHLTFDPFASRSRTGEEDAGNNPAHHPDDSIHRNDDAEAEESHSPASSQPH